MKAAPMIQKPSFPLMKQGDIQSIYHLQMPRWLFTDERYMPLSLEAKVAYTFLLNRFQLSRLNAGSMTMERFSSFTPAVPWLPRCR